jgi:hypothetical protein
MTRVRQLKPVGCPYILGIGCRHHIRHNQNILNIQNIQNTQNIQDILTRLPVACSHMLELTADFQYIQICPVVLAHQNSALLEF